MGPRTAPAVAWTGKMRIVCDKCAAPMGEKACPREQNGLVSHSKCPACAELFLREIDGATLLLSDGALEGVCALPFRRIAAVGGISGPWDLSALTGLVGALAVSGESVAAGRLMRWLVAQGNAPEKCAAAPVPAAGVNRSWWHRWEGEHA